MPAAAVQPVQRWLRELVAEFGWLPGDQGAVAAAGAADVDGPVRLACHAVPGLDEVGGLELVNAGRASMCRAERMSRWRFASSVR